jgi:drug/metabolite transporter (DMT)-like permease
VGWLLLVWLFWGIWAFSVKKAADLLSIPWAYLVGFIVTIPTDIYFLSQLKGWPSKVGVLWGVVASAATLTGTLCYLQAAKKYPGTIVTVVGALYPIVAVVLFLLTGDKISYTQMLGCGLAILATVLMLS